jgi:hypothetical protein
VRRLPCKKLQTRGSPNDQEVRLLLDEVRNDLEAKRLRALAPQIVMEKRFLDLQFVWPHPAGLNGGPVFLARKHWQDNNLSTPLFSIENFGQSPALEATVVFELDDNNTDLSVPSARRNNRRPSEEIVDGAPG